MLRNEAICSAQIYLDYLNAHKDEGLGQVRAKVKNVQVSLADDMVLTTDKVLRSADGLVLRIGGTVYDNSREDESFQIQSINKRQIVLVPSPVVREHIESAFENKEPIILESDLTFLVKRVLEWYENYGNEVELPSVRPSCGLSPNNPIALSDNQYECAMLAMTSPLAYIWGAPGTGKTKHVLASCVLSYICAGKKVILVAPTNNALEQSLFGLLRELSGKGEINPAGKVIRLGVPSDAFRTIWPDVCEDGAVNWKIADIRDKIDALQHKISLLDESLLAKDENVNGNERDYFPSKSTYELTSIKRKYKSQMNVLLSESRKLTESKNIMPAITEFNVIAATVDTCIYRLLPDGDYKPDHVFLDEAGYCNVIKGMTLLGFGQPLTLLGDHMQLPPVFEGEQDLLKDPEKRLTRLWKTSALYIEDAVTCIDLETFCEKDPIRLPCFDKMQWGSLIETYRFGKDLAKILARCIYGDRFCSRSDNETVIAYINAPKEPGDKGVKPLRISHSEAQFIYALLESNLNHLGISIGVITPYRNQRRLIADTVALLMKKYKIDEEDMEDDIVTVHQSQGREWDIVLFSVTDCFNEKYFTDSQRAEARKLINTAVSRARKMLILVGDVNDWKGKNGQLLSELFGVGKEINTKENVVEMVKNSNEEYVPWMENFGSLYFALSLDS